MMESSNQQTIRREHYWGDDESRKTLFAPEKDAKRAVSAIVRHVERYLEALRTSPEGSHTPKDLYFIAEDRTDIVEVLGFRMRGHPTTLIGAFRIPRHVRSPVPHGRQSIMEYISTPPRTALGRDKALPASTMLVRLPRLDEEITDFMTRMRAGEDRVPFLIDTQLIDFAFDFRFQNPSEITHLSPRNQVPERSVFRTIHGHVVTGIAHGLRETLHRGVHFLMVADAGQHDVDGFTPLPTLAMNRHFLTMTRSLDEVHGEPEAAATLAFHPATANAEGILGFPLPKLD